MALKGAIAKRYAEAAFSIANENNAVEQWLQDLTFLNDIYSNHQLQFILSEPKVQFSVKEAIIRDIAAKRMSPMALNFALLIAEHNLVALTPAILRDFTAIYDEMKNQAHAVITSAAELDSETITALRDYVKQHTGKNIILTQEIDPSILGGIIVRIGDTLIDASVLRKLKLLRESIAN